MKQTAGWAAPLMRCEGVRATPSTAAVWRVYRSWHTLIGSARTPAPRLHVSVHLEHVQSGRITTYDVIPQDATSARTALSLLAGRCVPAVVRARPRRRKALFHPRYRPLLRFRGLSSVPVQRVDAWLARYRGCGRQRVGLDLGPNNCVCFAERMERMLRVR